MPRKPVKPKYSLHRPSGQARVRINGKDRYLGVYGSPESYDAYDRLIRDWMLRNDPDSVRLTVDELALKYTEHAATYYRKDGRETSEVHAIRQAFRPLVRLHGHTRVRDFGPLKLKEVRQAMIDAGVVRRSINKHAQRIKRAFRWGLEQEIVPAEVVTALDAIPGLREGRSEAAESSPVEPVPEADLHAVRSELNQRWRDLVDLQLVTAARPGELLKLTTANIDRSGPVWTASIAGHKTVHHGKRRMLLFGPKAQILLHRYLDDQQPGNRLFPVRRDGYSRAVKRVCDKLGVPRWHPNGLRHNAGTRVRAEFGIEAARVILGHSSAVTSEIYAEKDMEAARFIMRKIG